MYLLHSTRQRLACLGSKGFLEDTNARSIHLPQTIKSHRVSVSKQRGLTYEDLAIARELAYVGSAAHGVYTVCRDSWLVHKGAQVAALRGSHAAGGPPEHVGLPLAQEAQRGRSLAPCPLAFAISLCKDVYYLRRSPCLTSRPCLPLLERSCEAGHQL